MKQKKCEMKMNTLLQKVSRMTEKITNNRSPGPENTIAELFNWNALGISLHKVVCQIWKEGVIHLLWEEGLIFPIYKKGHQL
jgi:hypothetical protein